MSTQAALYGGMAALELVGGYFAAQNIRDTAALNQEIAEMNAEFAELDAYDAEVEGYSKVAEYQKVIDQTLSQQQASLTAADVDLSFGSVSTIKSESKFIGDMNKMELKKRAQEQAMGYESQARDYRFKATLGAAQADAQASQVEFQSLIGATKTGLTAAQKGGAFKADITGYGKQSTQFATDEEAFLL